MGGPIVVNLRSWRRLSKPRKSPKDGTAAAVEAEGVSNSTLVQPSRAGSNSGRPWRQRTCLKSAKPDTGGGT
eukprot:10498834-Karenia_brevis.AAC.1